MVVVVGGTVRFFFMGLLACLLVCLGIVACKKLNKMDENCKRRYFRLFCILVCLPEYCCIEEE